jgi:prepilin-type N-terminal cleavage/methylation domain-containing protein
MKNKNAFTLLEALIALSVLAIGMLGIYTLLGQSINVKTYSNEKIRVTQVAYERFLQLIHYPDTIKENIIKKDGYTYKFSILSSPTMLPGVEEKILKTESSDTLVEIFYYDAK